jgi:hypothetical protein
MHLYYDRQSRPISHEQWMAEFSRSHGRRHVASTDLKELGRVSTVWMGLNHAYDDGPPLIFETMIFGGPMDQYMDRYTTEDQARTGHEFLVLALLTKADPETRRPPLIHNGRKPR